MRKYLQDDPSMRDADSAEDAVPSMALFTQKLAALQDRIHELPASCDPAKIARLQVQVASVLVDLGRSTEAWDVARQTFDTLAKAEDWEQAALACLVLFQAEQPDSMAALGQAIWIGVTFPIDPELTVAILQHVVDETSDDSDGAAVAAAAAHYIADLRAQGRQREDLMFFTNNLLATVARRHGDVGSQKKFDAWLERLGLDDPEKFLVRLRNIVDVLVQDHWWIDREAIQSKLPLN